MRRIIVMLLLAMGLVPVAAQTADNGKADNIAGNYLVRFGNEESKVRVTKEKDNTFTAQIYWVKDAFDKDGKKRLDVDNPDKSLRNVPCDEIVLIRGLKYNSSKQQWDGAKIYDPTRGIRANAVLRFNEKGQLAVKGSLMGISETVIWDILK
ncbi:MAG: DUF2147 domain-containing protein [Bacteroidaceae bacterium]|nr:DUF2147 domain-containing protein [Candidatus Colenecus caballi]MCQ2073301.1 DUF2147 domain-containing protein [Bacteroidaceae bacterium]